MRLETPAGTANGGYEFTRKHRRQLFSIPFTLCHLTGGGVRMSRGISLDISEGGIGALVQDSLHVGDTVAIDLPLPERVLNAVAIVRHTSGVSSGFEFVGLKPEERSLIRGIADRGASAPSNRVSFPPPVS